MSDPKYVNIGTPAIRIAEERGEILQAVGKGERFGWRNHHPDTPNTDNLLALENEVCDLLRTVTDLKISVQQKDSADNDGRHFRSQCEHGWVNHCPQCGR